jgi:hypothetical protein
MSDDRRSHDPYAPAPRPEKSQDDAAKQLQKERTIAGSTATAEGPVERTTTPSEPVKATPRKVAAVKKAPSKKVAARKAAARKST